MRAERLHLVTSTLFVLAMFGFGIRLHACIHTFSDNSTTPNLKNGVYLDCSLELGENRLLSVRRLIPRSSRPYSSAAVLLFNRPLQGLARENPVKQTRGLARNRLGGQLRRITHTRPCVNLGPPGRQYKPRKPGTPRLERGEEEGERGKRSRLG